MSVNEMVSLVLVLSDFRNQRDNCACEEADNHTVAHRGE